MISLTLELLPVALEWTLPLVRSVPAVLLPVADVLLVDAKVLPPAQVRGRPRARHALHLGSRGHGQGHQTGEEDDLQPHGD